MGNAELYRRRRADGACTRCGMPAWKKRNGTFATLCGTHMRMDNARRSKTDRTPAPHEPKRPPYVSDGLATLPPLPTDCPRCATQLIPCELEVDMVYVPAVRCMICAYTVDRQMLKNRMDQLNGILTSILLGILFSLSLVMPAHALDGFIEAGAGLTQFIRTADDGVWRQEGLGSKTDWQDVAFRAGVGIRLNPSWSIGTNYIRLGTVKIASQFVSDEDYDAIHHVCLAHCAEAPSAHVWGTLQGGELIGTYHPQWGPVSPIVRGGIAVFDHTVRWQMDGNQTVNQFRGIVVAGVVGGGLCYQQWACADVSYYRGVADTHYPVSSAAVVSMGTVKYQW